ncbi:MAG: zinc-binding alcohol dehydrogenase [Candidatus Thorarchaeota archaeon]
MIKVIDIIGKIYSSIPKEVRPYVKNVLYYVLIRLESLFTLRKILKGKKVVFLGHEIAFLEDFEFLGPKKNEILIEVVNTMVSPGTESAVLLGLPGARRSFPYTPGYSATGKIIEVGKKVKNYKKGDYIAGRINHLNYATAKPDNFFKLPKGVSADEASFIELGIIVLQGIRKAKIKPGYKVAVVGQGLIGQIANKLARITGATEVVGVAYSKNREETAIKAGGVTKYIALKEEKNLSHIKADIVIEAVGAPSAVETSLECVRDGGRIILLGSARGLGRNINFIKNAQKKNITIIGAHISAMPDIDNSNGRWTYKEEGQLFLDMLKIKKLSLKDLITWKAEPDECNKVYEVIAEGGKNMVGIMFNWSST